MNIDEKILEYIREEMKKADRALKSAQKLLSESLTEDAVSRAYYAVFHGARSALMLKGIETGSHKGLISQFAMHLVKPGLIEVEYSDILRQEKEDRETGDYETFVTFSSEEAMKLVNDAQKFVLRIRKFLQDQSGIVL
ncbi:MAG: HEPN domain-containing protein [Chlamydiae bacterium]|nr:HEPN domain-containing protein [Chlamydiota bacterium]MBI3265561.1 HEPN domain-containing protein [Chlamydiota bacterium]